MITDEPHEKRGDDDDASNDEKKSKMTEMRRGPKIHQRQLRRQGKSLKRFLLNWRMICLLIS
jgi:hypothetical protein